MKYSMETEIREVIGVRAGRYSFASEGIVTLFDLSLAIRRYGLYMRGDKEIHLAGRDAPLIRNVGHVLWGIVLSALTDIGFDWSEYVNGGRPRNSDPVSVEKQILDEVAELTRLLEKYIAIKQIAIGNHDRNQQS